MADARNAQLKHVRKTDGKNDPALDTAEASSNKVLAGTVRGWTPSGTPACSPTRPGQPHCPCRAHALHLATSFDNLQREPPSSSDFVKDTHSRTPVVTPVRSFHLQPGGRRTWGTRRRCTLSWSPWPPTRR